MSELLDKTRTEFRARHLPGEIKIEKLKQAKKLSQGVNSKRTEQAYLNLVRYNKTKLIYNKELSQRIKLRGSCRGQSY